jgi:hypothetical protein
MGYCALTHLCPSGCLKRHKPCVPHQIDELGPKLLLASVANIMMSRIHGTSPRMESGSQPLSLKLRSQLYRTSGNLVATGQSVLSSLSRISESDPPPSGAETRSDPRWKGRAAQPLANSRVNVSFSQGLLMYDLLRPLNCLKSSPVSFFPVGDYVMISRLTSTANLYRHCHHPTLFLSTRRRPSHNSQACLVASHTQYFGKYGRNHGSGVHFGRCRVEG